MNSFSKKKNKCGYGYRSYCCSGDFSDYCDSKPCLKDRQIAIHIEPQKIECKQQKVKFVLDGRHETNKYKLQFPSAVKEKTVFKCKCDCQFKTEGELKSHSCKYTEEKIVFKCKCGVECKTDDELRDHVCNQISAPKECIVCLDAPSKVLLNPCGHAQFCNKCATQLKTCPVCRSDVLTVIKVFM